ncbi:MAG TPA: acyltransferase [Terracidiphilus sp.]|nr:acyltransferase [Terracidiphilus sp.]
MASTQVVVRPDKVLVRPKTPGQRDLSIDYLRTTLILVVVALHSAQPYTSGDHSHWRNMILSDGTRLPCFDYVLNFFDTFFMSLFFFISGLFIYPALRRHGKAHFLRERVLRLGVPFAFSVAFLLPIAFYPSWRLTGNAGFARLYLLLPARDLPIGPPWFLWELLFFDFALILLLVALQPWIPRIAHSMTRLRNRPITASVTMFFLSAAAYLPLNHHFGPGTWTDLFAWPFSFQTSHIGLYALWFLFGFIVGVPDIENGLIARNGSLARHWKRWFFGSIVLFNVVWQVPRWIAAHPLTFPHARGLALLYVVTCVASSFGFLALFRGIQLPSLRWMKSLGRSAYSIYLVNYVFIAWMQFIVWKRPLETGLKFLFVFVTTMLLSWLTAQALLRVPVIREIL